MIKEQVQYSVASCSCWYTVAPSTHQQSATEQLLWHKLLIRRYLWQHGNCLETINKHMTCHICIHQSLQMTSVMQCCPLNHYTNRSWQVQEVSMFMHYVWQGFHGEFLSFWIPDPFIMYWLIFYLLFCQCHACGMKVICLVVWKHYIIIEQWWGLQK